MVTNGVSKTAKKNRKFGKKRNFKINLVFDQEKRRDFLTGFHKRKLQRKKKAKEDLEKQLKEEKKRLKTEAKESYKKLVVSHRPIPEVENFLVEEQENDDVKVKIEEMSYNTIADENNWIGPNRPSTYDEEDGNDSVCEEEEVELPGMELRQTSKKVAEHGKHTAPAVSKKDVKRILKKQATKNMQKSKVFQQKSAVERIKQKKSALQQKKLKMMQQKKHGKVRHRK